MGIVTVAEAKVHMNVPTTDTSHDTEISGFVDAATPVIEDIVGAVLQATFDELYDGGRPSIVLRHNPVISITSLTEYSGVTPTVLTVAATPDLVVPGSYVLDPDGILYRAGTGYFTPGRSNVRVVYVAGRAAVPANIRLATLELVRHLYQSTQQGGRPSFNGGATDDMPWAPSAFAVPTRVIELLAPHKREPRIA